MPEMEQLLHPEDKQMQPAHNSITGRQSEPDEVLPHTWWHS